MATLSSKGFTLIELMIFIAIFGILYAAYSGRTTPEQKEAKENEFEIFKRKNDCNPVKQARRADGTITSIEYLCADGLTVTVLQ